MNIGTKKALGIVTCKRPEYFKEIIETTPFDSVDRVYVFDSSPDDEKYVPESDKYTLLKSEGQATVGFAKNRLWEKMMEDGMDHLYLQEGDVKIEDHNVFDLYLETAKQSGVWGSLSHAWHGKANKDKAGLPLVKNSIDYDGGVGIDFCQNGAAAFTYHHANVLKHIGVMDEFYQNAWEHLDHYYRVYKARLGTHWWWFPDAKDSINYLSELDDGDLSGSVIRQDPKWQENILSGSQHFKKKFGFGPIQVPQTDAEEVLDRMDYLATQYSA